MPNGGFEPPPQVLQTCALPIELTKRHLYNDIINIFCFTILKNNMVLNVGFGVFPIYSIQKSGLDRSIFNSYIKGVDILLFEDEYIFVSLQPIQYTSCSLFSLRLGYFKELYAGDVIDIKFNTGIQPTIFSKKRFIPMRGRGEQEVNNYNLFVFAMLSLGLRFPNPFLFVTNFFVSITPFKCLLFKCSIYI